MTLEIRAETALYHMKKAGGAGLLTAIGVDYWPPKAVLRSDSCAWTEFWLLAVGTISAGR